MKKMSLKKTAASFWILNTFYSWVAYIMEILLTRKCPVKAEKNTLSSSQSLNLKIKNLNYHSEIR